MLGVEPTLSGIEGEAQRLRCERNSPRSGKCRGETSQHHKVSVKCDSLDTANAERGQAVLVLEPPELPFH